VKDRITVPDHRRQTGGKSQRARRLRGGRQEGADTGGDDPFKASPTKTITAGPLPSARITFVAPGFPLPTSWMLTPCIRATTTAKSMLPIR
jgi:hypothetical protein